MLVLQWVEAVEQSVEPEWKQVWDFLVLQVPAQQGLTLSRVIPLFLCLFSWIFVGRSPHTIRMLCSWLRFHRPHEGPPGNDVAVVVESLLKEKFWNMVLCSVNVYQMMEPRLGFEKICQ